MPRVTLHKVEKKKLRNDRHFVNGELRERHTFQTDTRVTWDWLYRQKEVTKFDAPHPEEPGFYAHDMAPEQTGPLFWTVDYTWKLFRVEKVDPSPTARPAVITVASETATEDTNYDHKNRLMTTTAGEPVTGLQRHLPLMVYRVRKNLGSDPDFMETHVAAINQDSVKLRGRVRPKHTLMLRRFSLGEYVKEGPHSYTVCDLELHYNPLDWIKRVINMGTVQAIEFKDKQGKRFWEQARIFAGKPRGPVQEPVPLDIHGKVIRGALDPTRPHPIDPAVLVILKFELQPILPFTGHIPIS